MSTPVFPDSAVSPLAGRTAIVAGGTGNVGRHIVGALLRRGAIVAVPSRSAARLQALRTTLGSLSAGLVPVVGDIADERTAARARDEALERLPAVPDAVVASLGRWFNAPSLLSATRAQLVGVLEDYVVAHFVAARTLLPVLNARGGSYTLINGPSSASTWPGSGLVSIATAAQAMLARALADELGAGGRVRITDLVIHPSGFIGPDGPGAGPIDGAAVGRFVAALVEGRVEAPSSAHLRSPDQLTGLP